MKVTRVGVRRERAPLTAGAGDARRRYQRREPLVVVLADGEGHLGFGELAPLPGLSRETLDEAEASLMSLPGSWDVDAVGPAPEGFAGPWFELPLMPSLRFALETALFDLLARRAGQSFEYVLGGAARERQPTAHLVTALEGLEALAPIAGDAVKVKLGRAGAEREELAALRRFRTRVGPEVELRLDANEAWSKELWLKLAPRLAELSPAWVEDPVPVADWAELPKSPVCLAIDAPLHAATPELAARLLERADVTAVVLKPTLLGGLQSARALADAAAQLGRAVVYSHAYEGPLGFSAIAAASLCHPAASGAAGLGPHAGLVEARHLIERLQGTELVPGTTPGLGRAFDGRWA